MGIRTTMLRHAAQTVKVGARAMSTSRTPMTRFVQYPFDKTKMDEVRAWVADSPEVEGLRAIPGVQNVEISFCPGQGWLAARYIFTDLAALKAFGDQPQYAVAKDAVLAHEHYDSSRDPQEFKGFYLWEV